MYIGIGGMMQNGKDSIANYLKGKLDNDPDFPHIWERAAFATNVKRVFADTFNVSFDFIEEWKVKPECPPGFDMPVRQSLQFIGDGFRKIKSTIWIDLTFRDKLDKIISDVRYLNEAERVFGEEGFNILIAHPDRINDDPNGSEAQIRPYAVWCLENLPGACSSPRDYMTGLMIDDEKAYEKLRAKLPALEHFHLFVRNDRTIQYLYETTDKYVVPSIKAWLRVM